MANKDKEYGVSLARRLAKLSSDATGYLVTYYETAPETKKGEADSFFIEALKLIASKAEQVLEELKRVEQELQKDPSMKSAFFHPRVKVTNRKKTKSAESE